MKPKIAVFDFASCEGCELQIANLEEDILEVIDLVDIVSFREVMKEHSDDYDIAFIEGSINRPIDEERLKKIRANAKILIAYGDCACTGGMNKLRNDWSDRENLKEVYADANIDGNEFFNIFPTKRLDEIVDVDFYIRGCPVRKEQVLYYIKRFMTMPPRKNKDIDFDIKSKFLEIDDRSLVKYNPNKCILCRRCSNICQDVLGVDALGVVEKGNVAIISTPQNIGFEANGCIRCGQCVSFCPVGALDTDLKVNEMIQRLNDGSNHVIALDSISLASYVEAHPILSTMEPAEAEKMIVASLKEIGFSKVVQYDKYLADSLKQDSSTKVDSSMMSSWCLSAQLYVTQKHPHSLEICDENSPWKLLVDDMGKSASISLLTPCTALKGVEGLAFILSSDNLDELFKQMGTDVEFAEPEKGTYDGELVHNEFQHPGIPGEHPRSSVSITHDFLEKLETYSEPVDVYPCLMRCVSGGGNRSTIDELTIQNRIDWVKKLRGVN
ncbi:MAG: 4Fe-4S binding protein [Thermoplasmata archaeon]|nr:4Fe-4S binding protein [Thermoplasmata archaeon]